MKLLLARLSRNKQGQITRTEETIDAEKIEIGRGASCKIHLPDPRLGLTHATISKSAADRFTIQAEDTMVVDGSNEQATLLKAEQIIQLGPYRLQVLPPKPETDIDVSITLELTEPLPVNDESNRTDTVAGLDKTWLSKRALSWLCAAFVMLSFIAWPVHHALKADSSPHKKGRCINC